MGKRHFLTVDALGVDELTGLLDLADRLRAARGRQPGCHAGALRGRSIGLLFEKPSTRTRVSFEIAIAELGAHPVVLAAEQLQLGRGEALEDTARTLSAYLHALVVRTYAQERLEALAAVGGIPVINALSDSAHPCQALADLQTIRRRHGRLAGVRLAYVGDGNNVANSLLQAGAMTGMRVAVACPPGHGPDRAVVAAAERAAVAAGGHVRLLDDPVEAVRGADVVYTDVWVSMGQDAQREVRAQVFRPYQVDARLLAEAGPDAIVMHCLPAHRGEEITAEVLDGPRSVVWEQAEDRLHAQKALLLTLLADDG